MAWENFAPCFVSLSLLAKTIPSLSLVIKNPEIHFLFSFLEFVNFLR
jgi:hypothetical protein